MLKAEEIPRPKWAKRARDSNIIIFGLAGAGKTSLAKAFAGVRPSPAVKTASMEKERLTKMNREADTNTLIAGAIRSSMRRLSAMEGAKAADEVRQTYVVDSRADTTMEECLRQEELKEDAACEAAAIASLHSLEVALCTTLSMDRFDQHEAQLVTVETLDLSNICLHLYDCVGIIETWAPQLEGMQGIIYVVDGTDEPGLRHSITALVAILNEDRVASIPLIVVVNKSDRAMLTCDRVRDTLRRDCEAEHLETRPWTVQAACALDGTGLQVILDWLIPELDVTLPLRRRAEVSLSKYYTV